MAKVITLGEIMLRLSTQAYCRFPQASAFDACYGGAEANVAASLACFGHKTEFVTRLPDNPFGDAAVAALRRAGVGTAYVARGGTRLGLYFVETGVSVRGTNIVYDRAGSAMSEADDATFDWDSIFSGADWFHVTGITPALGPSAASLTEAALRAAKAHGVTVSMDLNYRKKLWRPDEAQAVMPRLMPYVDICIGNDDDIEMTLGLPPEANGMRGGILDAEGYRTVFHALSRKYGFRCMAAALTEFRSASENAWSACAYDGERFFTTGQYCVKLVDRIGVGDAFSAGLICGLLDGKDLPNALQFATAASALKHTVPGDFNLTTRKEVEAIAAGNTSGRANR